MARQSLACAFKYAMRGVIATFLKERNMKIHCAIALCAIALGFILSIDAIAWCAVVICIGLVMSAECINTALEAVVDLASPEQHKLAALAKDAAAGGVLICACISVVVGCIVYIPRICALFALC